MKTVCSYLMIGFASAVLNLALSSTASADINKGTHLNTSGQTKVNNAMAKRWSEQAKGEKTPTDEKRVVNVGSKRQGTCNVNVGTTQSDSRYGRQPKDVVVTTKEVINVCK